MQIPFTRLEIAIGKFFYLKQKTISILWCPLPNGHQVDVQACIATDNIEAESGFCDLENLLHFGVSLTVKNNGLGWITAPVAEGFI